MHQCGAVPGLTTNHETLAVAPTGSAAGAYTVAKFLDADAMGDAYAISSLVVCRSGAGTTNELAATGRPAILVPLVPTGGDEQRPIAHQFAQAGAAIVVPNEDFTRVSTGESRPGVAGGQRSPDGDVDRRSPLAMRLAPWRNSCCKARGVSHPVTPAS